MKTIEDCLNSVLWKVRAFAIQKDFLVNQDKLLCNFYKSKIYNIAIAQSQNIQKVLDTLEDETSKTMYLHDFEYLLLDSFLPKEIVLLLLDNKISDLRSYYRELVNSETDEKYKGIEYPHYHYQTYTLNNYIVPEICEIQKGDVIFDIGAFDGLTSKKFADMTGENGKVYAVEANPKTAKELAQNILAYKNISIVENAFYDRNCTIGISDDSSSSSVSSNGNIKIDAILLDEFIYKNNIKKCDFIKMDIEGAELRALHGSVETIRRFKPKLAICIYHNGGYDRVTIPIFIKKLNLEYKMYVRKYNITSTETVLFCV